MNSTIYIYLEKIIIFEILNYNIKLKVCVQISLFIEPSSHFFVGKF